MSVWKVNVYRGLPVLALSGYAVIEGARVPGSEECREPAFPSESDNGVSFLHIFSHGGVSGHIADEMDAGIPDVIEDIELGRTCLACAVEQSGFLDA